MHNNSGQNDKSKLPSSDIKSSGKKPSSNNDSVRINLTISKALLQRIDEAAKQDYTTRSDVIRQGVLFYLRPQGRELDQTDPETILKVLNQRKMLTSINRIMNKKI